MCLSFFISPKPKLVGVLSWAIWATRRFMQRGAQITLMVWALFCCFFFFSGCLTKLPRHRKPTVNMSWNEKASRLVVLAKDLGLPARVQPRGLLPYSHNASAAVWVGVNFPYDKAIRMLIWARNYYLELRYIAISDYVSPYTSRYDNDLFIGGSTSKALQLNLQPWRKADFKALKRIKSQKAFHAFIRSRYPGPNTKSKKKKNGNSTSHH